MCLAIVVIGRNEGQRLVRCLQSVLRSAAMVVYVDSDSSDGSAERAAQMGALVVRLDLSVPFTAGRARNAGFAEVMRRQSNTEWVQFVDGDCEVAPGWLELAQRFLESHADVAVVCGRRRERYPEFSVYNYLCDLEWDTPVGDADQSGGDFMVRTSVFAACGGFHEALIAGEEPELGHRIRSLGHRIVRVDHEMTLHDAAITSLGQWAKRSMRSGYAYAARAAIHLHDGTHYCWKENTRITFWAAALPALIVALALLVSPLFLLLALLYPLQYLRLTRSVDPRYAFFLILGKWPELAGQSLFLWRWVTGRAQRIIEYK